jgi:hypothetical protein
MAYRLAFDYCYENMQGPAADEAKVENSRQRRVFRIVQDPLATPENGANFICLDTPLEHPS